MVDSAEVASKTFSLTKFREGYSVDDVREFLQTAAAALENPPRAKLTAADVAGVRFQPTRFRSGFDQDEVDDYLDRIASALNKRG